jgi:hypothetical protein
LSGDGTYHTHEFGGTIYYMPNGVEHWHGNYGEGEDGMDGTTSPAPSPSPAPTPSPTPAPAPSPTPTPSPAPSPSPGY